jgi:hypothetical protein
VDYLPLQEGEGDVEHAVELFKLSYELAKEREKEKEREEEEENITAQE